MCSFFLKRMDNDRGDLADIVRASGGGGASINNPVTDWQFPIESMNFPVRIEEPNDDFSDPFSNIHDPLLHELDIASSMFFNSSNSSSQIENLSMMVAENQNVSKDLSHKILDQEMKPYQLFSKMLQISPSNNSSSPSSHSPRRDLKSTEMIKTSKSLVCSVDNSSLQLSSPRNPGIKRRKNQTKKVVCIPAPTAANSRPSGEVVPSDLWAWRKYGQKPIKGSPYPRGYYRCSSSKGCSARKQVERSRTDPNTLVITYTSEHNHPWPTQRNALAGSTRSQPVKNSSSSKISTSPRITKSANVKEENDIDNSSTLVDVSITSEKPADMDDQEFDQSFHQNQADDFFAELGEFETDPVNLMFPEGFTEEKTEGNTENKSLDPFNLFDWPGNSFADTRRGL